MVFDRPECSRVWLMVLKKDKRFVFSAASHAQRAADYLHSLQPSQRARAMEKSGPSHRRPRFVWHSPARSIGRR